MTKLLIGLGLLILFGALFSLLTALRAKLAPEKPSDGDAPAEPKETEKEEERTVLRAVVRCTGGGVSFTQYQYQGIRDCLAASQLPGGGPLKCEYGCLGMGTCEKVCPSGAIQVREGVAVVEGEKCTACGKCVEACPRHIIFLEPYGPKRHVSILCASPAAGEEVTQVCSNGCTGCSLCVESCPREAITVEDGLARIDYEKCDHCARCASNCPRHLIRAEKVGELPQPEPPKEPRQPRPQKERPPKEPKPRREKPEKPPKEPKPKKEKPDKPLKEFGLKKEKPSREPGGEKEEKETGKLLKLKLEKKPRQELVLEKLPDRDGSKSDKAFEDSEKTLGPAPKTESAAGSESGKEKREGPKTSAEAFEAFAQVVAAAGEALGEKEPEKEPEPEALEAETAPAPEGEEKPE